MIAKRLALALFALFIVVSPVSAIQNLPQRPGPASVLNSDAFQPELQEAERRLQTKLKTLSPGDKRRCMIHSWLGAVNFTNGDYGKAISYLQNLAQECDSQMPPKQKVLVHKHLADCYYADSKFDRALKEYSTALDLTSKLGVANPTLVWELREDLGGCYYRMKNYSAAEKEMLNVLQIQQSDPGPDKVCQGWTYLTLSDIYRKLGDKQKHETATNKCIETFRSVTRMDLLAERRHPSLTPNRDLWSKLDRSNRDLPLISWLSPNARGTILCIHGLGLHNGAFAPFGREMRERGWNIYALDVRGFGSWTRARGQECVDFDQCIDDVNIALKSIQDIHPNLPIFLLGESMGGAIALNVAAKYPQLLTGVISSVPAGDRQNDKPMELRVAFNFLFDRDKNLDIGDDLAKRVTEKEQLRQRWERDPRARLSLSSRELVHFDYFMKHNDKIAAEVQIPTLITQGASDALVKPMATISLYNKVAAKDKDLLVIGQAEHLLFEAGQFSDLLLDGVDAWLQAHIKPKTAAHSADTWIGTRDD